MKKELELFSPTQEGILVSVTTYLRQMVEFAKTEWRGITINETHIKKAWAKLQKNEYLEDDAPDEMLEMYEKMSADWDMALELEEERINIANQPVEEPVNESLA